MAGGATVGSSRGFRLDPHTLPARAVPQSGDGAAATFIIERDRALVRRVSAAAAGMPADMISVPVGDFAGVAVRMESIGEHGEVRGYVELLHADPALTLPLTISDDPEEVAADWQAWSRTLNLPLLIVGQDGSINAPLANVHGVHMARAKPRRRHSYFAQRRPRFLTRRKPGRVGEAIRVHGREIIARD